MRARTDERKEFLFDVFTTALEGGIGYWSIASKYHWSDNGSLDNIDLDGFYAVVSDSEADNDDDAEFTDERIDIETISRGVNKIIKGEVQINSDLRKLVIEASRDNDAGLIDAEGADCIVQVGLFGEIIYG